MVTKIHLIDRIKREEAYLHDQAVGSEEYNACIGRLSKLYEQLADLEKFEIESAQKDERMQEDKKDRTVMYILEGTKIAVGVLVPMVGLVCITATEKETSFTGALREYTKLFIPKRMF